MKFIFNPLTKLIKHLPWGTSLFSVNEPMMNRIIFCVICFRCSRSCWDFITFIVWNISNPPKTESKIIWKILDVVNQLNIKLITNYCYFYIKYWFKMQSSSLTMVQQMKKRQMLSVFHLRDSTFPFTNFKLTRTFTIKEIIRIMSVWT